MRLPRVAALSIRSFGNVSASARFIATTPLPSLETRAGRGIEALAGCRAAAHPLPPLTGGLVVIAAYERSGPKGSRLGDD
jgi:hypothetical protein